MSMFLVFIYFVLFVLAITVFVVSLSVLFKLDKALNIYLEQNKK